MSFGGVMRRNRQTAGTGSGVLSEAVQLASHELAGAESLEPLLDRIRDAKYVLLGEASHGTSEYYTWRAHISRRLIQEKGFSFIAVEGDWPDCYTVNRYVKGYVKGSGGAGESAREVLQTFQRWPTWMWANWEVVALAEWLRRRNDALPDEAKVGFYGLDVYSLWESLASVMGYLEETDPDALEAARRAYRCFEPYGEDPQDYAEATAFVSAGCEREVVGLLSELRRKRQGYPDDLEARFDAEQNARAVVGAERYYRAMVRGGAESWNVRDRHMVETLQNLMAHHGPEAKAIIWEHNTHIGDARATDMAEDGMVNVGQLVREQHSQDGVVLVGFGSYRGSVVAGSSWGAPMARMEVPEAKEGSWEEVFHQAGRRNALLLTERLRQNTAAFGRRGHRAIGVVYRPASERYGNYVPTVLPERYDAFLYLEETEALHPLHLEPHKDRESQKDRSEFPETYPWGL
jgi:erythromycin esterase